MRGLVAVDHVFVAAVAFCMDLRGVGHELTRVLQVRVCDERVMRGLLMVAVEIRERGEFVVLRGREVVRRGFAVEFGRLM